GVGGGGGAGGGDHHTGGGPRPQPAAGGAGRGRGAPVTRARRAVHPSINAAESGRGGSLRAMIPASFSAAGGPTATASTRKPCASSWLAVVDASGDGCARPMTAAKAPFTART